jgi:hypothetical protein
MNNIKNKKIWIKYLKMLINKCGSMHITFQKLELREIVKIMMSNQIVNSKIMNNDCKDYILDYNAKIFKIFIF